MNPLRTYAYLSHTRGLVFDQVRELDDPQYAAVFPIGLGTIGRTLTHIMISEWYYVQRIIGADVPPYAEWPIQDETPPSFAELEATWTKQSADTRAALGTKREWDAVLEYEATGADGIREVITTSPAGLMTQLAFHEVHHRAQVLNMLHQLGSAPLELDFNAFYPRRPADQPEVQKVERRE